MSVTDTAPNDNIAKRNSRFQNLVRDIDASRKIVIFFVIAMWKKIGLVPVFKTQNSQDSEIAPTRESKLAEVLRRPRQLILDEQTRDGLNQLLNCPHLVTNIILHCAYNIQCILQKDDHYRGLMNELDRNFRAFTAVHKEGRVVVEYNMGYWDEGMRRIVYEQVEQGCRVTWRRPEKIQEKSWTVLEKKMIDLPNRDYLDVFFTDAQIALREKRDVLEYLEITPWDHDNENEFTGRFIHILRNRGNQLLKVKTLHLRTSQEHRLISILKTLEPGTLEKIEIGNIVYGDILRLRAVARFPHWRQAKKLELTYTVVEEPVDNLKWFDKIDLHIYGMQPTAIEQFKNALVMNDNIQEVFTYKTVDGFERNIKVLDEQQAPQWRDVELNWAERDAYELLHGEPAPQFVQRLVSRPLTLQVLFGYGIYFDDSQNWYFSKRAGEERVIWLKEVNNRHDSFFEFKIISKADVPEIRRDRILYSYN